MEIGKYKILPWEAGYVDSCVAMAMEKGSILQAHHRTVLGDALWDSAYGGWEEALEVSLREQLGGENAFVLLENGAIAGFGSCKTGGKVGAFGICHGKNTQVLEALYGFLLARMKESGALCAAAEWEDFPGSEAVKTALEKVGFQKGLPHVRYYQTLKPRPELPETDLRIVRSCEAYGKDCANIALKLWTVIHGAYAGLIGDDIHDITGENWQETLRSNISMQQSAPTSLVALLDGKVVGFCGCRVERGKLGVIGYNGVDPEYRGRGIARYLYEAAFDQFREQGICHARVFTGGDDGHGPARRAYEKAGYDKKVLSTTYYQKL